MSQKNPNTKINPRKAKTDHKKTDQELLYRKPQIHHSSQYL